MSERKVFNKYFPVEFDPALIPKASRPQQVKVRVMLPFSMQCKTCGEFTFSGKKFNAKKEDSGDRYLGITIWRFYIRCGKCSAEITFKTDPEHRSYTCETGATRSFDHNKANREAQAKERTLKAIEETADIIKQLENKSIDTKREQAQLDELEDLLEQGQTKSNIDLVKLSLMKKEAEERLAKEQELAIEREDDLEVQRMLEARRKGQLLNQGQDFALSGSNFGMDIQEKEGWSDDDNSTDVSSATSSSVSSGGSVPSTSNSNSHESTALGFGLSLSRVKVARKRQVESANTDIKKPKLSTPDIETPTHVTAPALKQAVSTETSTDDNKSENHTLSALGCYDSDSE